MLAVLYRRGADRDVPFPRRRGVDEVEILRLAEALEVVRSSRIRRRLRLARVHDPLRRALHFFGDDVAERRDADAGDVEEVSDVDGALAADADVADAHGLHRRRRKEPRVLRRGRLGRRAGHERRHGCAEHGAARLQDVAPGDQIVIGWCVGHGGRDCRPRRGATDHAISSATDDTDLSATEYAGRSATEYTGRSATEYTEGHGSVSTPAASTNFYQ